VDTLKNLNRQAFHMMVNIQIELLHFCLPYQVGPRYPTLTGTHNALLAFLDFDQFVREESMRFAVDRDGGFFVRGLNQAKDLACALVEPVFQVFHAILLLSLQISGMSALNGLSRQSIHMLVDI
jgi:hypothetical protein